jgi:hypothetical protein
VPPLGKPVRLGHIVGPEGISHRDLSAPGGLHHIRMAMFAHRTLFVKRTLSADMNPRSTFDLARLPLSGPPGDRRDEFGRL